MNDRPQIGGIREDFRLNKTIGTIAFWIHRITGIGLAFYLVVHFIVLSSAIAGPETFDERMALVQSPFFAVLELVLIAGILIHMLNGLRITVVDFFGRTRLHKTLFWIALGLFVILFIGAVLMQLAKFDPANYALWGTLYVL